MKILIISQYYYPEQFQINEIAPELVRRGHEVIVLCGLPNYPKGAIFEGYENQNSVASKEKEYFAETGVKVVHVKQIMRGNNPFTRMGNYFSFARNSRRMVRLLDNNFDIILGYQLSPITSMEAAVEYKRLHGTPLVFYTLDIWPVSAQSMLKFDKNPLMIPIKRISKRIYQSADKIIVTSRPFIDYLHQTNEIPLDKMSYLPQHAGADMMNLNLCAKENGIVDFLFAGNIGKGQRVDVIIEAARLLGKRKDYKIHIVGDGSMRQSLEKLVCSLELDENVLFYGNQKREVMPHFYQIADVLLITLRGNNEVGNTMPGKLQMYMTTGKPILGAINGAAHEVIEDAKCGSCVNAGDSKGLAELMQLYIERPNLFVECGQNARDYFKQHFTLGRYMDGLERELNAVIKRAQHNI
ncbi:MAG: glycosyltransferase family 4 protein [Alistipes sp.]